MNFPFVRVLFTSCCYGGFFCWFPFKKLINADYQYLLFGALCLLFTYYFFNEKFTLANLQKNILQLNSRYSRVKPLVSIFHVSDYKLRRVKLQSEFFLACKHVTDGRTLKVKGVYE